jgi:hypothetical protein
MKTLKCLICSFAVQSFLVGSSFAATLIFPGEDVWTIHREPSGNQWELNGALEIDDNVTWDTVIVTLKLGGPDLKPYTDLYLPFAGEEGLGQSDERTADLSEIKWTLYPTSDGNTRTGGRYQDLTFFVSFEDSLPNGLYPLSLTESSFGPSVLLLDGNVVDTVTGPANFMINIVPEPSSVAISIAAMFGLVAARRLVPHSTDTPATRPPRSAPRRWSPDRRRGDLESAS